jgi:hypothetical protein
MAYLPANSPAQTSPAESPASFRTAFRARPLGLYRPSPARTCPDDAPDSRRYSAEFCREPPPEAGARLRGFSPWTFPRFPARRISRGFPRFPRRSSGCPPRRCRAIRRTILRSLTAAFPNRSLKSRPARIGASGNAHSLRMTFPISLEDRRSASPSRVFMRKGNLWESSPIRPTDRFQMIAKTRLNLVNRHE